MASPLQRQHRRSREFLTTLLPSPVGVFSQETPAEFDSTDDVFRGSFDNARHNLDLSIARKLLGFVRLHDA